MSFLKYVKKTSFCVGALFDVYADYVFPWDKFERDPEGYQFTSEDIAYTNAMELEEYELKTPMTPYERRVLRRWVAAGHGVRETLPSRYPCAYPSHPAPDFLDVYRTDRNLDAATKGMSKEQMEIPGRLCCYPGISRYPGYGTSVIHRLHSKNSKNSEFFKANEEEGSCRSDAVASPITIAKDNPK